jgi:PEP-CTERM motif
MKRLIQFGLAAATLALLTTSASAVAPLTGSSPFDAPLASGQTAVVTFDGPNATGYTFSSSIAGLVYNGADGLHPNIAAPPFGDLTHYMAIQDGQSATLNTPILKSLSLYIGSLDPTNEITFKGAGGYSQSFMGSDLFTPATGNQSNGDNNRRFFFDFTAAEKVDQIIFTSGQNSFEFDTIGALASGVPEPGTWAMMLLGFGGIGFMLRAGKRRDMGAAVTA